MTSETILTILGVVLGSGAFFTFLQFLITRRDDKKDAIKDVINALAQLQTSVDKNNEDMGKQNEALKALAQDRIIFLARSYIKQNWIYDEDLSNMRKMANSYRALGGNDLVKIEMDIVDTLEVRPIKKGGK